MTHRAELIALLRGGFAVPLVAALARLGVVERFRHGPVNPDAFPELPRHECLAALLDYLVGVGLLARTGTEYRTTRLGVSVLDRVGAFLILDSYHEYLRALPGLLSGTANPAVDRRENVLGSGALHRRKFFPAALDLVRAGPWEYVADVGCGDGTFLECFLTAHPGAAAFPVDLSGVAVREAALRLAGRRVTPAVCDGFDVGAWAAAIPATARGLVSLWFVLHEFGHGRPERVVSFFHELASRLPGASVLVGEIFAIESHRLAGQRHDSIMPEFLLFHALSGQGVLSWAQFQEVLGAIPYSVAAERQFDPVGGAGADPIPSSVVWLLEAKERCRG